MPLTERGPDYIPHVDRAVVSAVRLAFQRARTSPRYWQTRRNQGRFDARNVWRFEATDRTDIFRERNAPGATKVNLHILVDGSGSMGGSDQKRSNGEVMTRIQAAADIAATLVDAFRTQPTVRTNVYLHNTNTAIGGEQMGGDIAIYPIVINGKGREVIGYMPQLKGGGNGDGYAIAWVAKRMKHDHRRGEVDLLIVISDGLPSWLAERPYSHYNPLPDGKYRNSGVEHVANVVRETRETGARVMAVAIGDEAGKNQYEMYGDDGDVIPFTGDWNKLAVEFGSRLGATLATAGQEKRGR